MTALRMDNQPPSTSNGGFPPLLSDEEFENLKQRRLKGERLEHDRLDTKAVQAKPLVTDGRPASAIEQQFPHVSRQLVAMWPSEACALYIKRLVISDRGARQGFPQEVIDDLMMLYQINEMRCRETGVSMQRPVARPVASSPANVTQTGFNWDSMNKIR
jgi:hypothetical protein